MDAKVGIVVIVVSMRVGITSSTWVGIIVINMGGDCCHRCVDVGGDCCCCCVDVGGDHIINAGGDGHYHCVDVGGDGR